VKILAVDDSKTLLMLLSNSLKKMGHEVVVTTNPKESVTLYIQEQPDLVILDVVMTEDMSGYDCAKAIRKAKSDDVWIPIIFLSSMIDDDSIAKGIDVGGDDYLTKPVSEITLAAKIRAMQRIADMRKKLIETQEKLEAANDQLYDLSYIDGLTKIANRRFFDEHFNSEWRRACRLKNKEACLSLIMIDIDHFKFYNDFYGHKAGDDCLKKVANILRANLRRAGDVVCRYGGEEFVVLMPHTGQESAVKMAHKLKSAIESMQLAHKASPLKSKFVTISVGVASVKPKKNYEPMELLNCSDMALYKAKEQGRNCVCFNEKCFSKTKKITCE
jgi:diguanylate cyclase (GGDEF)-like protein